MIKNNSNPILNLDYELAIETLGDDYYDLVPAAEFPQHVLRFRNDSLLPLLGLNSQAVSDADFVEAFGKFQGMRPFLALRYHGYQFGQYNPYLGDGRGFIYGQVRGSDGNLYDLGTKGSGRTPYSRTADGRLTLKGGVREVLAAEALLQLRVKTSRCLSLIETGESLWRGDEPSPTRSSVMVRLSRSHIRFGTFERLHYIQRSDLIEKLLDSVIKIYYSHLADSKEKHSKFYAELVERVGQLAAQWMAAGFCHGVLNTDNMSITGESFDYGPYAFIPTYDPQFTAAYFDYGRLYSYANQPLICKHNLEMLQIPLKAIISPSDLEAGLAQFEDSYQSEYQKLMLQKLGFAELPVSLAEELLTQTIKLLRDTDIGYHEFFAELASGFNYNWRQESQLILAKSGFSKVIDDCWRSLYHLCLNKLSADEIDLVSDRLKQSNPQTALLRPVIESVWQPITEADDWQPFYDLLSKIQNKE